MLGAQAPEDILLPHPGIEGERLPDSDRSIRSWRARRSPGVGVPRLETVSEDAATEDFGSAFDIVPLVVAE